MRFYEIRFAIPFHKSFRQIIHFNTNQFINNTSFYKTYRITHIRHNHSFHQNLESFSTLGLITSCLDYCINIIRKHTDSSLLFRRPNTMQSFSTLASFTTPCMSFLRGLPSTLYAHNN